VTASPRPSPRARADHRPEIEHECAGCGLLSVLLALKRTRIRADGRLGCEPGAGPFLADHRRDGARLLVAAGPEAITLPPLDADTAVVRLESPPPGEVEAAVWQALRHPQATALVATVTCRLGAPRSPPLAVDPARCNRCGGCLSLGCPAIEDGGGESMVVDPTTCTGCALCAPLCRARAIGRTGA
jgi:Pyruvate/2-oxoacid:ferredoxin oxidoreductase delta subunit